MSQIKGEILREKYLRNISFDEKKSIKSKIALPVGNNNEVEEDDDGDDSDDGDDGEDDINDMYNESSSSINSSSNNGIESYWFEALDDETFNDTSDESDLDDDSEELKSLLKHRVHPADNKEAKWKLARLFKPGLKPPNEFISLFSEKKS